METEKSMEERFSELDEYIDNLPEKHGALITTLHKAQNIFGYLPTEVQNHVAHKLDVPSSKVYGIVTFYSFFNLEPKGEFQFNVCTGTACFVRGSQEIVEELEKELQIKVGETSEDGMFSLSALRCVGACGLAPVLSVNGRVFGRVEKTDILNILQKCMEEGAKNRNE